MTRLMFLRFCHREAKKHRHCTGQAGDLFEPSCKTFTVTHQKATKLENIHIPNLEKVTTTSYRTETSTLPLEINTVKKSSATLDIYGEGKEDHEDNITKKIIESFKSCFNDIEVHQIHKNYLCKRSNVQKSVQQFLKKCQRKINSSISGYLIQNCQNVKRLEFGA